MAAGREDFKWQQQTPAEDSNKTFYCLFYVLRAKSSVVENGMKAKKGILLLLLLLHGVGETVERLFGSQQQQKARSLGGQNFGGNFGKADSNL